MGLKPRLLCTLQAEQYHENVDRVMTRPLAEPVRSKKGIFSYAVGYKVHALLVAAAAAASTPDGSVPERAKPDETHYV